MKAWSHATKRSAELRAETPKIVRAFDPSKNGPIPSTASLDQILLTFHLAYLSEGVSDFFTSNTPTAGTKRFCRSHIDTPLMDLALWDPSS